ncbi:hypothetical protein D3C84_1266530 [compost metagenome]
MVLNDIRTRCGRYNRLYRITFAKYARLNNDLVHVLAMRCFHYIDNLQRHLTAPNRTVITNLTTALCIERRTV